MIHGLNGDSPLVCEGIIGDGCGGGRFFLVKDETLVAYDPQTESEIFLLDGIKNAKVISKKGCILTIKCEDEVIRFDLSALTKV